MTKQERRRRASGAAVVAVLVLLAACQGAGNARSTTAQEDEMELELTMALDRESYLQNESIVATLTLTNRHSDIVETASLQLNDTVVGLELSDAQGSAIGTYHRNSLMERLGDLEVPQDRFTLRSFDPGQSEIAPMDLLPLAGTLAPGDYRVAAVYRHGELELRTPAVSFTVEASRPQRWGLGADQQMGRPYHLLTAWIDRWEGKPILMDAATFDVDPTVWAYGRRLEMLGEEAGAQQLVLSTNVDDTQDFQATAIFRTGSRLSWRGIGMGTDDQLVGVDRGGSNWHLLGSAFRENASSTVVCLSDDARSSVEALRLHADGSTSTLGRYEGSPALMHAFAYHPRMGALYLQVLRDGEGWSLWSLPLEGDTPGGTKVAESRRPIVALAAVVDPALEPLVAYAIEGDRDERDGMTLHTRMLGGAGLDRETEGPSYEIPVGATLQLGLDGDGKVHLLAQVEETAVLYGDPEGEVLPAELLAGWRLPLPWIVGFRGYPFAAGTLKPTGLTLLPPLPIPPPGADGG